SALYTGLSAPAHSAREATAEEQAAAAAAKEQAASTPQTAAPPPAHAPPAEPHTQRGPAALSPPGAGSNGPSFNGTINLINRLVQKGLLTKEDAADLLKQAEADAAIARVQIQQDAIAAAQLVVQKAISR